MPARVLVAVPHKALASVIAGLLRGIGVKWISETHDSAFTARLLSERAFDAVVLDNDIGPEGGIKLTRHLRITNGPNKTVPVIMISSGADRRHIESARDAGIHEFLRLPISAEVLRVRLAAATANPRAFVSAPEYAGPDRRRRRNAYRGAERRTNR
ncbi:response regulator [Pelagibacterium halotolerans]|uniref:response regulator n=1 Tax=Pelagibacterium halotolerans TaxID=531813 RepID=UPI00384CAB8E